MENTPWPFQIGVFAAIIGNILWYWIKSIIKAKGYKVHSFIHSGDLKKFKEIIRNEDNPESKKKYELILKGTYVAICVLVVSFAATVLIALLQGYEL